VFCSFLDQVETNRFFAKKINKNQSPGLCEINLTSTSTSYMLASAAKCMQKLFCSRKMAEFAHSEPDLASQPRYLPLVSMSAPWDGGLEVAFSQIAR
jgi:hypothetical protein